MHPKHLLQLHLDCRNIKQRGLARRVNEKIQITSFGIVTMQHRPKDPGVAGAMTLNHAADAGAVGLQGKRRLDGFT